MRSEEEHERGTTRRREVRRQALVICHVYVCHDRPEVESLQDSNKTAKQRW